MASKSHKPAKPAKPARGKAKPSPPRPLPATHEAIEREREAAPELMQQDHSDDNAGEDEPMDEPEDEPEHEPLHEQASSAEPLADPLAEKPGTQTLETAHGLVKLHAVAAEHDWFWQLPASEFDRVKAELSERDGFAWQGEELLYGGRRIVPTAG
jgi:hypothetical protein